MVKSKHSISRSVVACAALAIAGSLQVSSSAVATAPPDRYVLTANTVRDTRTNLTWERSPLNVGRSHSQAVLYCAQSQLGGQTDWRLPTRSELASILDWSLPPPLFDPTAFPNAVNWQVFWTSTPYVGVSGGYWTVSSSGELLGNEYVSDPLLTRCVR